MARPPAGPARPDENQELLKHAKSLSSSVKLEIERMIENPRHPPKKFKIKGGRLFRALQTKVQNFACEQLETTKKHNKS